MSGRAARRGAPSSGETAAPSGAGLRHPLVLAALCGLALAGCGGDKLKHVDETFEIVGGEPSVDPTTPTVEQSSGGAKATDFGSDAPVQVDVFHQEPAAKVDILWVVDDSPSMKPKQDKLKANFQGFMQKLQENNASVDYHIGVVTTDVFNPKESGKLQNHAGLSKPWIGKDTCSGGCDPVAAFRANATVGDQGSGDEKPLLAAEMALSAPLATVGANQGFLRPDASLFVIVLSDEEDGSCAPIHMAQDARYEEGCDTPEQWGSPDYYVRFFEGLKGFGHQDLVTVGAIVAVDQNSITVGGQPAVGCQDAGDADNAQYAGRTLAVAQGTGGVATSICDASYLPALQDMGFLATGAKSRFYLTRAPYASDLQVFVTAPGGQRTLETPGVDYDYKGCSDAGGVENAVEFHLGSIPSPGSTIEVSYPVNVRGVTGCN